MSVVAVTGCSGYIGSRLLRFLDESSKVSKTSREVVQLMLDTHGSR